MMFFQIKKKKEAAKQLPWLPRDGSAPETAPNVMRKRERDELKMEEKGSFVAVMSTTISGLKIPPVGEKNKLLKDELAFLSITALAGDACTKQSPDLIFPTTPTPFLTWAPNSISILTEI